jgi:cobalamin biosynthesis protein CobD/CbiB
MLLDAMLGEPDWLWKRVPHPVVLIGKSIGWLDRRMNLAAAFRRSGSCALGSRRFGPLCSLLLRALNGGLVAFAPGSTRPGALCQVVHWRYLSWPSARFMTMWKTSVRRFRTAICLPRAGPCDDRRAQHGHAG